VAAGGDCVRGPSMAFSPEARGGSDLVDVEVVGDDLHVQEPKDEQPESGHADECEHNQDEARESVGREVSRATWQPSALCGRFGGHPITMVRRKLGAARTRARRARLLLIGAFGVSRKQSLHADES
jgi:hypothetical protein